MRNRLAFLEKLRYNGGVADLQSLHYYAELMELADMQDLGSCAARRVGSSPTFRIIFTRVFYKS